MYEKPNRERRNFVRFRVNIHASYIDSDTKKEVSVKTHDISRDGLCLLTDKELIPGSALDFWLSMEDNGEKLCRKGTVIWSGPAAAGKYRCGIKIEDTYLKPIELVLRTIKVERKY